jgi:hypothetical protein
VILVRVYCKVRGCGKLLTNVVDAPTDEEGWIYWVRLDVCPKHGGGHGPIPKWIESQKRLGRPTDKVRTHRWVQWSELRPAVEQARSTGRTATHAM